MFIWIQVEIPTMATHLRYQPRKKPTRRTGTNQMPTTSQTTSDMAVTIIPVRKPSKKSLLRRLAELSKGADAKEKKVLEKAKEAIQHQND